MQIQISTLWQDRARQLSYRIWHYCIFFLICFVFGEEINFDNIFSESNI